MPGKKPFKRKNTPRKKTNEHTRRGGGRGIFVQVADNLLAAIKKAQLKVAKEKGVDPKDVLYEGIDKDGKAQFRIIERG
ncbi:hypothetical protein KKB11_00395 [Candidatus Micrarchaeota archaeon]|nr:hypothetical protein [Candidatus Micrarchaeota archaeon]